MAVPYATYILGLKNTTRRTNHWCSNIKSDLQIFVSIRDMLRYVKMIRSIHLREEPPLQHIGTGPVPASERLVGTVRTPVYRHQYTGIVRTRYTSSYYFSLLSFILLRGHRNVKETSSCDLSSSDQIISFPRWLPKRYFHSIYSWIVLTSFHNVIFEIQYNTVILI